MAENLKSFEEYWSTIFQEDSNINREGFFITEPNENYIKKTYEIEKKYYETLSKISNSNNVALYIVLTSGISYLLGRYTNSTKIVLGIANFSNNDVTESNKIIPIVFNIYENYSLKEWINYTKSIILEGQKHTEENIKAFMEKNGLCYEQFIKTVISLNEEGSFNTKAIGEKGSDSFTFYIENGVFKLEISCAESVENEMDYLIKNIFLYFEALENNLDKSLEDINIINNEEILKLEDFNKTDCNYDFSKGYCELFKFQCEKTPKNIAVVENEKSITYEDLDMKSSKIASYLKERANVKANDFVAVLYPNSIQQVVVSLAVAKSGGGIIPLDIDLPKERIKFILKDANAKILIFPSSKIKLAQEILWECDCIERVFCADSFNVEKEKEEENNMYMDKSLWEYVGDKSKDDITLGGWSSSYTGEYFSTEEMQEYSENVLKKLRPFLTGSEKVLEVGCGSGLTMFPLSVYTKEYHAIDLSESTIKKNKEKAKKQGLNNITLSNYAAHDVKKINEDNFDLVIMNSVVQCFNGHNYLKNVLRTVVGMMKDRGYIFIGDIMDLDKKKEFEISLKEYKKKNPKANTKTDLSEELFLSKEFFDNIPFIIEGATEVKITPKIYTIENELTLYRYDVLIKIDKRSKEKIGKQTKFLESLKEVETYGNSYLESFDDGSLDDSAIGIYTSGTTGNPKGVVLSKKSILNLCFYSEEVFKITENDRRAKNATFSFDAAIWEVYPFLLKGASIYIIDKSIKLDLVAINEFFEENKITIAFFTTQVAEQFMKLKNTSLRYLIAGGEKLRRFYKNGNYKMMNVYGPTETTVVATNYIVTEDIDNIPIGKPFPNVKCYIVDSKARIQPLGGRGEIYIGGLGVGKKYINLNELTKERFVTFKGNRIYKSGDYGYYKCDGNIMFFGRRDGQVKINGFRIEVSEIEKHILSLDIIKEAVVLDFSDDEGNKYLCCYYVAKKEFSKDELSEYLSEVLPNYMIPAYFVRLEKIPYTINGKLIRKNLPNPKAGLSGGNKVKPTNHKEEKILDIWKKVLGIEDIGIEDDFFELGGNSIKAIKVVSAMSEDFRVDINKIFNYTTVKSLAENVEYVQGYFQKLKEAVIEDQTKGINEYDKKKIDEKYKRYLNAIPEYLNKDVKYNVEKYKNILLLGGTGFLGSHILYYLIKNTPVNITIISRGKDNKEALNHVLEILNYYFEDITKEDLSKLTILKGEISKEKFNISKERYKELCENIDGIINAAANVHHYGDYNEFYGINTEVLEILTDFAQTGKRKDIHHISTVGIATGAVEGCKDLIFTEEDFDVNQNIDNYYAKTKFLGEKVLYEARKKGINANIYRMGNLVGRATDGFFQKNMKENGFYKIIKAMISIGIVPKITEKNTDLTFIDNAAEAVVRLAFADNITNDTFHIQNINLVSINQLGEYLKEMGLNINLMEYKEYLNFLFDNHNEKAYSEDIQTILLHTHLEENIKLSRFKVICDKTEKMLEKCGFKWTIPDTDKFSMLIKCGIERGFLNKGDLRDGF